MTDSDLKEILKRINELQKSIILTSSPFMDIGETAEFLRCSISTVRHLVSRGLIPYRRLPGGEKSKLLFSKKKLSLWVEYEGKQHFTKRERESIETFI